MKAKNNDLLFLVCCHYSTTKLRKWDSSRSMRWNQDAQREEGEICVCVCV